MEIQELIRGYWKEVGIEISVKPADRSLYDTRVPAAEHDVASRQIRAASPGYSPLFHNYIFPMNTATNWCPMWGLWFNSGGKSGEEPPQEVKDFMQIREDALLETDSAKRVELIKKAFRIFTENLYAIGVVQESPKAEFAIVKNSFINVPEPCPYGVIPYFTPAQFFFE